MKRLLQIVEHATIDTATILAAMREFCQAKNGKKCKKKEPPRKRPLEKGKKRKEGRGDMRQRIAGAVQALDRFFPAGLSVQGMSAKAGRKGDGKGS